MSRVQEEQLPIENGLSVLEAFQIYCYKQTCQSFAKDTWNENNARFGVVITESPSAPTSSGIAWFHKVRLLEIDVEKRKFKNFSFPAEDSLDLENTQLFYPNYTWSRTGFWL